MSISGLPTFLISVKNMNLLSSSIYKHVETYLIKYKQSLILGECDGIKFRFQFIKMSDRDLKFVYLFCQIDMFLFVIETPIGKFKHPFNYV
jgi:hypothetical protein